MAISSSDKKKKKKFWYPIVAPKQFQNTKLGETRAYNAEELVGKVVKSNLMTLTNDPKKQSITLSFRVQEISNNTGVTSLINYSINNAHIKRLVRKASKKLEGSFIVKTKDNKTYRIKPIILTRYKANNSVLTALRKGSEELITKYIAGLNSEDVYAQIITHKLQMETKNTLKKIYPISICEIKAFTLIPEKAKLV
jgi:small subunit ribosomal protein S3Ae